jgi:putative drug exporter of the RND superfamily
VWVAAAILLFPFGSRLANVTNDDFVLPASSQTAQLQRILADRFPGGDQREAVIVYHRAGGLTAADRRRMFADAARAARIEHVARPIPAFAKEAPRGLVSPRGDAAITIVPIKAGKIFRVGPTIDALRRLATGGGGLEVHVTGFPALASDVNSVIKDADVKLLAATVALVLILLMFVYRSPVLALVPLVVVGFAYVVAIGVLYLLQRAFGLPIDSTSRSLLLVLMFGAGTDYCLLFVSRYRAALACTGEHESALRRAMPEAAPAMIASGMTVVVALLTMLGAAFGVLRTLGPVTAIGVGIVLLAALTLLPSLLSLLGPRAFWPLESGAADEELRGRWHRIGVAVRARPGRWLAVVTLALGAGALGLFAYKTDVSPVKQFRTATDGTRGFQTIQASFPPGFANPTTVLVDRRDGRLTRSDVTSVERRVRAVSGVAGVTDTGRRSRDGRAGTLSVVYADNPFEGPALARTNHLRTALAGDFPNLRVLVGQGSGERLDYGNALRRDEKVIFPLVLAVAFLALVLILRALVAPLFLLATVLLSYVGSLGASVLVFRYAIGQTIDPVVPIIIFIFLVALGSDYNIFLMSRVREESVRRDTNHGMLAGLSATGPVITSAGIILAGTFSVLAVLPFYLLLDIGFGVAFGVLVDTFLVRSICVPALTWLVGERSWWPSSVTRSH